MKHHHLKATPQTVHLGGFSPNLVPALQIDSGDRVDVETYTGYYLCDRAPDEFLTPELLDIYRHLPPDRKVGDGPHLLTGPIEVRDARPGDVLEIKLEAIAPRLAMGFNAIRSGWGALPQRFERSHLEFLPLDLEAGVAEFPTNSGIRVPLHPFFGILGVATDDRNRSSVPPGVYGGNLDNRELQAGSRIFLPVFRPGALFSIGDGHAAQGDGEVNVTAIETSMNGTIQIQLRRDLSFDAPFAETPTDLIVMGFAPTLDEAFEQALTRAIAFLTQFTSLSDRQAYTLCSLAVNFRITQVVNRPNKGIHGLIPKSILPDLQWSV